MPVVTNDNGLLYSWGWGKQSLHDDDNDRLVHDTSQDEKMEDELQVTSCLSTKTILAVSVGQRHSACATSQGILYVVGTNFGGCVDPDLPEGQVSSKPVLLDSLGQIRIVQVSCGFDHTAIMSSNGSVLTFGCNSHGQLGHRTNNMLSINPGKCCIRPADVVLGKGRRASAIACGTYFTMVSLLSVGCHRLLEIAMQASLELLMKYLLLLGCLS
jgi:alpha-tubulin suppressor-like RCC1 family protein